MKAADYHYLATAENVAYGQTSIDNLMDSWMGSEHHRANILGDYDAMGAGLAKGPDGRNYWSVSFGRSIPKLEPEAASAELARRINERREAAGLEPLVLATKLGDAAQAAASAFAERGKFQGEGKTPVDAPALLKDVGYTYRSLGQQFATGQPTPEDLMETIAPEPEPKPEGENGSNSEQQTPEILGDHRDLGVGYATDQNGIPYWVIFVANPQ